MPIKLSIIIFYDSQGIITIFRYIMETVPDKGEVLEGNHRYEGYCKDLADLIAHKLGINCKY